MLFNNEYNVHKCGIDNVICINRIGQLSLCCEIEENKGISKKTRITRIVTDNK